MPASTTTTPEITTSEAHTPKSNALPPSTAHTHTPTMAQRTNQGLDLADEQNQEQTPVFEERNEAPTPRGTKVAPEERGEQPNEQESLPDASSIDQVHEAFDMQFGGEEEDEEASTYLTFVPTPEDGFPRIHGACMLWQAEGIDKKKFLSWLSLPGLKVIAQIFSENSWQMPRATALNEALRTIMGKHFDEENVSVLYGFSSRHLRDKHSPPTRTAYTTFGSPLRKP